MRQVEQLELGLWEVLKEAAIAPDEADLGQLLDGLDATLLALDTVGQLRVAAEAIAQIAQVFYDRSTLAFEELEATNSDEGPIIPTDAFDQYVRQSVEVDFEQFIEPLASLPRKASERQSLSDEYGSVVGELNQVALLQALDEQTSRHPGLTEIEIFNQALAIAHDEDVSTWSEAIAQCMRQSERPISLVELQQALDISLVEVWLGLLLGDGDYRVAQTHDEFYSLDGIQIY